MIFCGLDPGLKGGITIIKDKEPIIHKIPTKKTIINKKNKNVYDSDALIEIFKEYKDIYVFFVIERQVVRKNEGAVSAMTIGKNYGILLGMACAFGFNVIEITPQSWKKHFPQLITSEIVEKKEELKSLRLLSKTLKENETKKQNKKEIEKMNRTIRNMSKKSARCLASSLYPKMANKFEKANTDGLAESLLITLYGKENLWKG
jgi:Holliday junction resolvasome RuvABC endonuclease subunit